MTKKILLGLLLILLSAPFFAKITMPEMTNKPINIDSDQQKIDILKDLMIFTGNVVMIQDTLQLRADKVIVNHMKSRDHKRIIAVGSPTRFQQILGDNKKVDGSANKLVYDVKENEVTLLGNALLTHGDSTIRSQIVRYKLTDQHILADSELSDRVRTTLVPEQLSELNK